MAIFNSKLLVYQRVSLGCWGQSLHLHQPVTTCLDVFHVYASQYVVFRHIQAIYNPYNNYTTWILWPGIFQSYHCSLTSIRPGWNPTCSHRKNRAIFPPCEKLPKGKKVPFHNSIRDVSEVCRIWEIFRIRLRTEVPIPYMFGLFIEGLNFREDPHNSYGPNIWYVYVPPYFRILEISHWISPKCFSDHFISKAPKRDINPKQRPTQLGTPKNLPWLTSDALQNVHFKQDICTFLMTVWICKLSIFNVMKVCFAHFLGNCTNNK